MISREGDPEERQRSSLTGLSVHHGQTKNTSRTTPPCLFAPILCPLNNILAADELFWYWEGGDLGDKLSIFSHKKGIAFLLQILRLILQFMHPSSVNGLGEPQGNGSPQPLSMGGAGPSSLNCHLWSKDCVVPPASFTQISLCNVLRQNEGPRSTGNPS